MKKLNLSVSLDSKFNTQGKLMRKKSNYFNSKFNLFQFKNVHSPGCFYSFILNIVKQVRTVAVW